MKTKIRILLYSGIVLFVILIIIGRYFRHAKSDALSNIYSPIVTVSTVVANQKEVQLHIEETGTLQGGKEAIISAKTGGQVEKWFVNVGDFVKQGEPILKVDDELLRLETERAKVAYDKAKMDLERIEKLFKEKSVSETDYENAKLMVKSAEVQAKYALKTYEDATIRAPFSATIAAKMTEVGQMLERGMPAVQIVDLAKMKLIVNVSENQIQDVQVGLDVMVIVPAINDTLLGKVTSINKKAIQGSRSFPIEIEIQGNPKLKSGMFAKAILKSAKLKQAIVLPRNAVLPDAGNTIVFLSKNNTAEKKNVQVLGYLGESVAVDGLNQGDTVITVGNQLISQGQKIAISMNGGNP
ncbi:MAG: efflux RND transporter periplasmic adaptor subunit [bacterium]|nr:efflux RND transporter periplasmic adaptor subunit [bacterium]